MRAGQILRLPGLKIAFKLRRSLYRFWHLQRQTASGVCSQIKQSRLVHWGIRKPREVMARMLRKRQLSLDLRIAGQSGRKEFAQRANLEQRRFGYGSACVCRGHTVIVVTQLAIDDNGDSQSWDGVRLHDLRDVSVQGPFSRSRRRTSQSMLRAGETNQRRQR